MPFEIRQWDDIAQDFQGGSVIIGNGTSIAVDRCFFYDSLLEKARELGTFTDDVEALFDSFGTCDFELVLRMVWHATKVNTSLRIRDQLTREVYQDIREALIRTVRATHVEYDAVRTRLPSMYRFLKQFRTVLSLNYDLLVYWTMMYGRGQGDGHVFKDCFAGGAFRDDWARFRSRIGETSNTLVFYPHGSLALCRNQIEQESKITSQGAGLLDAILEAWESEEYIPLFVSEGTADQKLSSIQNSYYLSTVMREVLPSLEGSMTIMGWGLGEHDVHVLERLKKARLNRIACWVYGGSQAYCTRVDQLIRDALGQQVQVTFFDSATCGWAEEGHAW